MTGDDFVAIKGVKDGLLISLNDTEDWQLIINDLTRRIDEQSSFFNGAKITVNVGHRPLPKYQLRTLIAALERRGLSMAAIVSDSQTTLDSALALDLRTTGLHADNVSNATSGGTLATDTTATMATGMSDPDAMPVINPEEEASPGVMIRKTLRSGRSVHSEGHIVVFGDVNPGAEVVAGGDIIIWGVLRGNAHAGAYGNTEAVICALDMIPTQMRIAGHLYEERLTNRNNKRRGTSPETALIRDDKIVLEAWSR